MVKDLLRRNKDISEALRNGESIEEIAERFQTTVDVVAVIIAEQNYRLYSDSTLSTRAKNALLNAGVVSVADLSEYTAIEFQRLCGNVGKVTIKEIDAWLKQHNGRWKDTISRSERLENMALQLRAEGYYVVNLADDKATVTTAMVAEGMRVALGIDGAASLSPDALAEIYAAMYNARPRNGS